MPRISSTKQNHRTKHETHVIYENIIGTRLKEVWIIAKELSRKMLHICIWHKEHNAWIIMSENIRVCKTCVYVYLERSKNDAKGDICFVISPYLVPH